jgi:hypothetical protein
MEMSAEAMHERCIESEERGRKNITKGEQWSL